VSVQITPRTRVGAILEAYPELEEFLLAYSPHFEKLRNPILRRTVAKVATLRAAAMTAGVDVGELVKQLRARVGQAELVEAGERSEPEASGTGESAGSEPRPAWVDTNHVTERIDTDAMLNRNEHPLGLVKKLAASLDGESMIQLEGSFRPEPLIEALAADGYRVHSWQRSEGVWTTLITRSEHGGSNHVDR
jgi:hypothetical protein